MYGASDHSNVQKERMYEDLYHKVMQDKDSTKPKHRLAPDKNSTFELISKIVTNGQTEGFIRSIDYFGKMVTDLESSNNPDFSSVVPRLNIKKVKISK